MSALYWLTAMIVFLLLEAVTVTIVSLWFAVGALAAIVVNLCGGPVWLQVTVFAVVSVVMLAALRPIAKAWLRPKARTNVDSVIGTEGYVIEPIDNIAATGRVKLGSMDWTARSADGAVIPAGALVRVKRIEGVKAFVSQVKEKTEV